MREDEDDSIIALARLFFRYISSTNRKARMTCSQTYSCWIFIDNLRTCHKNLQGKIRCFMKQKTICVHIWVNDVDQTWCRMEAKTQ